ncbi:MAG: hypothetical protein ACK4UN_09990, partial [Limisphaerales bacterium]
MAKRIRLLKRKLEMSPGVVGNAVEATLQKLREYKSEGRASLDARAKSADSILQHARSLSGRPDWTGSERGRRNLLRRIQALETACFLDPSNREAQELRVRTRWGSDTSFLTKNRFRFDTQKSEAWGKFVDRFGIPSITATNEQQLRESVAGNYLESALVNLTRFRYSSEDLAKAGVPTDTGASIHREWKKELAGELYKRLDKLIAMPEMATLLTRVPLEVLPHPGSVIQLIEDPESRAQLIEKLWPALMRAQEMPSSDVRAHIVWTYTSLGKPEKAQELLSSIPAQSGASASALGSELRSHLGSNPAQEPSTNSVKLPHAWSLEATQPSPIFHFPPFDVLPPELKVNSKRLVFPPEVRADKISDLCYFDGKLWISADVNETVVVEAADRQISKDLEAVQKEVNRVWIHEPDTGTLTRASGDLTNLIGASFFPIDQKLWVTTKNFGLGWIDPKALTFHKANTSNLFTNAHALTRAGEWLFVTAENSDLYSSVNEGKSWVKEDIDRKGVNQLAGGELKRIGSFDQWLLLYESPLWLRNIQENGWKNVAERLFPETASSAAIRCIVSDPTRGFWIGSDFGLHFLNPDSETARNWLTPVRFLQNRVVHSRPFGNSLFGYEAFLGNQERQFKANIENFLEIRPRPKSGANNSPTRRTLRPTSRIPSGVSALMLDQETLWLATSDGILLYHIPSDKWIGHLKEGPASAFAASEKYVWVGLRL